MNEQKEITLHLDRASQLIRRWRASPFLKRRLRGDVEKFIIERATAVPRRCDVKLILHLPKPEEAKEHQISEGFHEHFAFRRDEVEKELRRARRFGLGSLVIALVFLSVVILLVQIIKGYVPPGHLATTLTEGLTILGWVALWRPGELLLYEWYPLKRDARVFTKLERAEIQIISEGVRSA